MYQDRGTCASLTAFVRSGPQFNRSGRLTRTPDDCQKSPPQSKTATSLRPPSMPSACHT
jgi:hypothetical protein